MKTRFLEGGDALLSVAEMYRADKWAMENGTPGLFLMEQAGASIAELILAQFAPVPVLILCGPGNNGGDGFVVARRLSDQGWPVTVAALFPREKYSGDAEAMASLWNGPVLAFEPSIVRGQCLVVDGVFGAGLSRPVDGVTQSLFEAVAASKLPVIAIDVPSGVHGDTGQVHGTCLDADATVTFFRSKPGHWLMPGRDHCGAVYVADIGIDRAALTEINPKTHLNGPRLWRRQLPGSLTQGHKYDRGHILVVGGTSDATGAARLAAEAAARVGAGLTTLLAPSDALDVYASNLKAIMVKSLNDFDQHLADGRKNAIVIGPAAGLTEATRERVLAALRAEKRVVLDADALSVFVDHAQSLFDAIRHAKFSPVLTPHEGEFRRLFRRSDDRLGDARRAAAQSGAHIVLKGPDTVIAKPDGEAVININAPPTLATAGSGDVLAGIIGGLLAQGCDGFDAACAGVWIHGAAAANGFSNGLTADDLPHLLGGALQDLERCIV